MRIELLSLPADLSSLPALILVGDPDGEIERRAFALCRCAIVGAARLALTIQNRFRREAWLRGFRSSTLQAAREAAHVE